MQWSVPDAVECLCCKRVSYATEYLSSSGDSLMQWSDSEAEECVCNGVSLMHWGFSDALECLEGIGVTSLKHQSVSYTVTVSGAIDCF